MMFTEDVEVKPEVIENPNVKAILELMNKQLDLLKLIAEPAYWIPPREQK